jgi:hypothetical protein
MGIRLRRRLFHPPRRDDKACSGVTGIVEDVRCYESRPEQRAKHQDVVDSHRTPLHYYYYYGGPSSLLDEIVDDRERVSISSQAVDEIIDGRSIDIYVK